MIFNDSPLTDNFKVSWGKVDIPILLQEIDSRELLSKIEWTEEDKTVVAEIMAGYELSINADNPRASSLQEFYDRLNKEAMSTDLGRKLDPVTMFIATLPHQAANGAGEQGFTYNPWNAPAQGHGIFASPENVPPEWYDPINHSGFLEDANTYLLGQNFPYLVDIKSKLNVLRGRQTRAGRAAVPNPAHLAAYALSIARHQTLVGNLERLQTRAVATAAATAAATVNAHNVDAVIEAANAAAAAILAGQNPAAAQIAGAAAAAAFLQGNNPVPPGHVHGPVMPPVGGAIGTPGAPIGLLFNNPFWLTFQTTEARNAFMPHIRGAMLGRFQNLATFSYAEIHAPSVPQTHNGL